MAHLNDEQGAEPDAVRTEDMLNPDLRLAIRVRCKEHARLKREIAQAEARAETLAQEVDQLMAEAGLGDWLLDGIEVEGHRIKLVAGETSRLNLEKLVRLGCDPQWVAQATEKVPRKVHVRFLHPKE